MKPLVEVLMSTAAYFKSRGIPSARLDAELLIGHALGLDRVQVYLAFDRPLLDEELEPIRALVRRRGNREPLAWIVGSREFYGRDFRVGPGVLVPRPDTETLIEALLPLLPLNEECFVADVGSGSGCIGLTLAAERPLLRLYAIDKAEAPLTFTRENVEALGLKDRVAVLRGSLLAPVPAARRIDWVVSNPPYIPSADIEGLAPEVRDQEPRLALDGGPDGLDVYRALVHQASARAQRGVAFEVGYGQAPEVAALVEAAGFPRVTLHADLGGVQRVVIGQRAEAVHS